MHSINHDHIESGNVAVESDIYAWVFYARRIGYSLLCMCLDTGFDDVQAGWRDEDERVRQERGVQPQPQV